MNSALKHYKKERIFLLFWKLKQMEVCWRAQVADVASAQSWRKSFSLVAKEWVHGLPEKEFSFTVHYQYYSTEIKQFSWNHYIVLQEKPSPSNIWWVYGDLPICRNTKPRREEVAISLQVSMALQTHRVGVVSKLHKVDSKGSRSSSSVLITSLCF